MQNSFFEIFSTRVNIVYNNALGIKNQFMRWFGPKLNALWLFVQREKYFEELCNTRDIHNL